MSFIKAKEHLKKYGLEEKIMEFTESSATVTDAAKAIGCKDEEIAKTLSFNLSSTPILIVTAGDARIDNRKFKDEFGEKAKMLSFDDVESLVGHAVGGVCPFGIKAGVLVYLDNSLKRFKTVYPACGNSNSAVRLTLSELETASEFEKWIDVCKDII